MKKQILKALFKDSALSVLGLVTMNVITQFVVYPFWNRYLGAEAYGDIIYLMSLINIVAVSIGVSCNYARMRTSADRQTYHSDYLAALGMASLLMIPYGLIVLRLSGSTGHSPLETVLFLLLMCLMMWRYYSDVEFRLKTNYKGYLCYYLIISAGYLLGIAFFVRTDLWALALIPGEAAGLIFVAVKTSLFRPDRKITAETFRPVIKVILVLFLSEALSTIFFNGDRLLLKHTLGGAAVTTFYLASLLGKTMSLITTPLNSVVIGHLVKYKGGFSVKIMTILTLLLLGVAAAATGVCVIASHIIIGFLYPEEYESVRAFFLIANFSQVLYFLTNILDTVNLRFTSERSPLIVNVVYAASFAGICIPFTVARGFWGFCIGILITCGLRFASAVVIGYARAGRDRALREQAAENVAEDAAE